jgi:hypothetical protein
VVLGLLMVAVGAVSIHLRLRGVAAASSLGDAIHPWWAALRDGWPRPHAAPYGWGLVPPYQLCLLGASSLWEAVSRMLVLHALAAPLAVWVAWSCHRRAWGTAGLIGVLVAVDPGLIDTALSGAEGHLAAVFIGLVTLGIAHRDQAWGPILAGVSFALAVMHHPLSVAAAPLLLCLRLGERWSWAGIGVALALLTPRLVRLAAEDLPGGSGLGPPMDALMAYIQQGGPGAWAVVLGPFVGLLSRRSRGLAIATLAAAVLLLGLGVSLDYLRDHHIRLLTLPALMGWLGLPPSVGLLLLLGVRLPPHPVYPAGHVDRPGTMGLAHLLTDRVVQTTGPLVVDGAWLSGGPAASPATVMLDLHLRGWSSDDLSPDGAVIVLVSGERADIGGMHGGLEVLERGDRHALLRGDRRAVAAWSKQLCADRSVAGDGPPRLGGAYDALSVLHPSLTAEQSRAWWACP